MADLPGFIDIANPNVSTQEYATTGPARIMCHMTVGMALSASYVSGHRVPPQLWVNPYTRDKWQTGSLHRPGKALYQPQFGNSWTNRHGYTIQIEIVGVPVVNQTTYTDAQLKWLGEEVLAPIMRWFTANGIPYDRNAVRVVTDSSGSASEYWHGRMSDAESSATGGIVQHILEWGNDHWDCSVERLDVALNYALAALGDTPPPPPPPPSGNLLGLEMFLLQNDRRGIWLMGPGYSKGLNEEQYNQVKAIPGIGTFWCGNNERAFDLLYDTCMSGDTATDDRLRTMQSWQEADLNKTRSIHTMAEWLLSDTKTQAGLQVGPAVGNMATELRQFTRVRLIEAKGDLWATDLIFAIRMANLEAVKELDVQGYFNNDRNADGPIPQVWSDEAFDQLVRADSELESE